MKKYSAILLSLTILVIFSNKIVQGQTPVQKTKFIIRHTVIFKFKKNVYSNQREAFFNAALKLAGIPGVRNFELLKQISKKNKFDFGISMEFDDLRLYEQYTNHKDHQLFIQQYWLKNVEDFLETDYELLK